MRTMSRISRWTLGVFAVVYGAALAIYAVGTFGLLGNERDPLAGVLLIPLGLPWNRFVEPLPEASWPWLAVLAPALNLAILSAIFRLRRSRQHRSDGRRQSTPLG
jgi:hypothetical protein